MRLQQRPGAGWAAASGRFPDSSREQSQLRPICALAGCLCALLGLALPLLAAGVELTAPAESAVGSEVEVAWNGAENPRDFITIVAPGTPEGKYEGYQYARQSPVKLTAPVKPGSYEIRYLSADSPYPTLARRPIIITDAAATLEASDSVPAGTAFEVRWSGPDNQQDFITLVPAGTPDGKYESGYAYTSKGSPVQLTAPDAAGDYEIRYLMGQQPYRTLGSRALKVMGTEASLEAPAEVAAGAAFSFSWQGPDNERDFITLVPQGAAEKHYEGYVYTRAGSPARLTAPDEPGDYEIRYLTGQTYATLARAPIRVTPVTAEVGGPDTIEARSTVKVTWEGPDNELDYIIIQPVGAAPNAGGNYAYTRRGKELRIQAPDEPGEYEYRYITGQSRQVLASRKVTVVPRPVPGRLRVVQGSGVAAVAVDGTAVPAAAATVTVVLDASGSMLQRLDGEIRIDIAKAALAKLIADDLPAEARFSLHVFGHREAGSCRTDIEIPLGPLDRAAAKAKVASINAMNLAKTPIGAALGKAGAALAGQAGPHLIILLTDGEETCDGDPAAVIRELAASDIDVRVNIVGFAIDELMLRETFAEWARLGRGSYLDARSAEELTAGLGYAIEVPFEVKNAAGEVVATGVVNGPALELPVGEYQVRPAISATPLVATIKADEETVLNYEDE